MLADEPPLYQSQRVAAYRDSCEQLLQQNLAFRCSCSRKSLSEFSVYPGHCRELKTTGTAVRLKAGNGEIAVSDLLQKEISYKLESEIGDFIIWRGDNLPAYQLAVVIDDHFQGITEVVRGSDLLESTPRQIHLQRALGIASPKYLHIPMIVDNSGRKLSKRSNADPVNRLAPPLAISLCLKLLGHPPPEEIRELEQLWNWASANWRLKNVPKGPLIYP